jgi:hypothetical protein
VRAFTRIRKVLTENTEIRLTIEKLENKSEKQGKSIDLIFSMIAELQSKRPSRVLHSISKTAIGYKPQRKKIRSKKN